MPLHDQHLLMQDETAGKYSGRAASNGLLMAMWHALARTARNHWLSHLHCFLRSFLATSLPVLARLPGGLDYFSGSGALDITQRPFAELYGMLAVSADQLHWSSCPPAPAAAQAG